MYLVAQVGYVNSKLTIREYRPFSPRSIFTFGGTIPTRAEWQIIKSGFQAPVWTGEASGISGGSTSKVIYGSYFGEQVSIPHISLTAIQCFIKKIIPSDQKSK
ncbi:hypothetical protein SAMN05518672_108205 [Chitinophaga sp. CF118]|nr:hypothetical protein SAMN05518672_108205 [Chitinophaga sp. CF118]